MDGDEVMSEIAVKRVYDPPEASDGTRILVDRLWPRGLTKERAAIDLWLKEIAPSTELRHWYGHDPALWEQFQTAYGKELDANGAAVEHLQQATAKGRATLLYSSHEAKLNNAVALVLYLEKLRPR